MLISDKLKTQEELTIVFVIVILRSYCYSLHRYALSASIAGSIAGISGRGLFSAFSTKNIEYSNQYNISII